jgi:hypothetical protein
MTHKAHFLVGDGALERLGDSSEWRGRFHRDPIFLSARRRRRDADTSQAQRDNQKTVRRSVHAFSFRGSVGDQ